MILKTFCYLFYIMYGMILLCVLMTNKVFLSYILVNFLPNTESVIQIKKFI